MKETYRLDEASKMLNITLLSLTLELKKSDCPYGYSFTFPTHSGERRGYRIIAQKLDEWIRVHPNKYHDHPDYTPVNIRTVYKTISISELPISDLLEEIQRRCKQ